MSGQAPLSRATAFLLLALVMAGHSWAMPGLIVSQLGIWASGVMFAANVLWALRAKSVQPAAIIRSPAAV